MLGLSNLAKSLQPVLTTLDPMMCIHGDQMTKAASTHKQYLWVQIRVEMINSLVILQRT